MVRQWCIQNLTILPTTASQEAHAYCKSIRVQQYISRNHNNNTSYMCGIFSGGGHSTYDLRPPLQPHHKYSGGGGPATSAVSNRLSLSHNLSRIPPSNGSGAASSQRKHPAAKENRSKSIRWTKDQLKKMDKLGHTGSCSSSSNGNVHDTVSIPVLLICEKRKYITSVLGMI